MTVTDERVTKGYIGEVDEIDMLFTIYVRTDSWLIIRLKKITGDFFQT